MFQTTAMKNTAIIKNQAKAPTFKDIFLQLAVVGILWILLWIPMQYFVSIYGTQVISQEEYQAVLRMAAAPSGAAVPSTKEKLLINKMASVPLAH